MCESACMSEKEKERERERESIFKVRDGVSASRERGGASSDGEKEKVGETRTKILERKKFYK